MLVGTFGLGADRPTISAVFHFPRIAVTGMVSLLVDTGADASLLNTKDALRIGLVPAHFKEDPHPGAVGIGGSLRCYTEQVNVAFLGDDRLLYAYSLPMDIVAIEPGQVSNLPSLLGRDILDRWHMDYDPTNARLTFQVHAADRTMQLPPP